MTGRADHHVGDVEVVGLAEVGVPHLVVLLLQFGGKEPAGSIEAFDALIAYELFDLSLDSEPPVVIEDRELGDGILAVDTGLLDLEVVLLGRIGSLHGEIPGRGSRLGVLVLIGGFVPHAMLQARAACFALGGILYENAPIGVRFQYLVEVLLDKRYSNGGHAALVFIPIGVEVEIVGIPVLINGIRDQYGGVVVRRAAVLCLNVLRQEHEKAVAPGFSAVDRGRQGRFGSGEHLRDVEVVVHVGLVIEPEHGHGRLVGARVPHVRDLLRIGNEVGDHVVEDLVFSEDGAVVGLDVILRPGVFAC